MKSASTWLFAAAILATTVGYLGPWIAHPVAGLVVTGIDLPEYVKFLPSVRGGSIGVWREGFYLPPLTISLTVSLFAFRPAWMRPNWLRWTSPILAMAAASLLLPPAWTPGLLLAPEFRLQTVLMMLCWGAAAIVPLAARVPLLLAQAAASILIAFASAIPLFLYMRILPEIRALYHAPIVVGWGPFSMLAGLLGTLAAVWLFDTKMVRRTLPENRV